MQQLLFDKSLADVAIERLRTFEPPDGYWLAYSGGKDSTVILDLARRSGVKFEAHYSYVPIDPPELRAFIKTVPNIIIDKPEKSFISVARERGIMPIRHRRWCCEIFKERGGRGRLVVTGLRWSESSRRSNRKMFEVCIRHEHTHFLHPIVDWLTTDVWAYIRERELPYCHLYDEGWKRLGCVLCPMVRDVEKQMVRWPRIVRIWRKICDAVWEQRKLDQFSTSEDLWKWWLDRDAVWKGRDDCPLFGSGMEGDGE